MDTIVATKILEQVPEDFEHNVSYKLKETSILNTESRCAIRYNNESEDDIKHIQFMMDEFDLSWEMAQQAMNAGW